MRKFVIDTSFFSNSTAFRLFGETPTLAIINFIEKYHENVFFITPSVWDELMKFINIEDLKQNVLERLIIKSPNVCGVNLPAQLFHDFIVESRARVDAATKYAVNLVKEVYKVTPEKKIGKIDPDAQYVKKIREGIRHHMRENILDSGTDLDVLLLAREMDAFVLTSDKGMIIWCDKLGIKRMLPEFFKIAI